MSLSVDAERLRDQRAAVLRRLVGAQISSLPSLKLRRAVLRLERRVRDERIGVRGLDDLRARLQAPRRRRRPCAATNAGVCFDSSAAAGRESGAALRRVGPSSHVTFSFLRAVCACHQLSATIATPAEQPPSRSLDVALDDERVADAGLRLDLVEVRALRPCRRTPGTSRNTAYSMPGSVKSMPKIGLPVTIVALVDAALRACR